MQTKQNKTKQKKNNFSPIPLTWIAILPIKFYDGNKMMKNIHLILTSLRFIEHLTFIVLSFILFDNT